MLKLLPHTLKGTPGLANLFSLFCKMSTSRSLIAIDFDHTLLDANSDSRLKSLIPKCEIPKEVQLLSNDKNGWTAYMREIFLLLHQHGVTPQDYRKCLSDMPLIPGMKNLLTRAHETGSYDIVIVSDANSYFIDYILEQNSLKHTVKKVYTNSAFFDDHGCLHIKEYQFQDWCSRCSQNICKGSVLDGYLSEQTAQGVIYGRISYIGDGMNDVCPALKLRPGDFIFARKGFPMLKRLNKPMEESIKARVVGWDSGHDILNVLFAESD